MAKISRKVTRFRVLFTMPLYRRTDSDPICAFCSRPITVRTVQASAQYKYEWYDLHGACALHLAEMTLRGEDAALTRPVAVGQILASTR